MRFISITQNGHFLRAYRRGYSVPSSLLVVYVVKNRLGCTRLGVTTSKKVGGAVVRNRARRLIKEAYAPLAPRVKSGQDIVVVARSVTPTASLEAIQKALFSALKKAGALC